MIRASRKKYLESSNLNITNGTFVANYEFESNFQATPTDEHKLIYWVNTQMKQLVIQFEPSNRNLKATANYFFLFILK